MLRVVCGSLFSGPRRKVCWEAIGPLRVGGGSGHVDFSFDGKHHQCDRVGSHAGKISRLVQQRKRLLFAVATHAALVFFIDKLAEQANQPSLS